ncbi:MAG: MoxR family ATPase [Terriglobia bacterium]|jgi:MoxR-like ATPase
MPAEVQKFISHARTELGKVIVGQEEVISQLLAVLLCGGHALLEGVPGIAKTLAVKVLAHICRLRFQRVQCTPDLMPADVLGANVFNLSTSTFSLHRGPVFTDLLLVDEVNRVPPRTQSALLEAMEERQVTIDGTGYPLSQFFTVFATQNPIEFEGTYPLPEAQLDRFLFKIRVPYPAAEKEVEILERYQRGFDPHHIDALGLAPVEPDWLPAARREVSALAVEPGIFRYMATIVQRTRDWPALSLGGSPRSTVALMFAAKALAAMEGRDYLIPDDVKAAAPPVLRHRLMVKPEAELEGITSDQVVAEVLAAVEVPK